MKKFVIAVAVLLLAAPVWALDVECTVDGCDVTVSFSGAGAGPVRGMAFDITVDGDGVISDVVCLSAAHGYQIFPGDISISGAGIVEDYGTCKCSGSYPGTLDASNGMTIEMASLYEDGVDPPPDNDGNLVSFRVSGTGDINVVIAVNTIRGGVVNEDASPEVSPTITGCQVVFAPLECLGAGDPGYARWSTTLGKPDCWCYKKQCRGDADGLLLGPIPVSLNDLNILRGAINKVVLPAGGECADFDHQMLGPIAVSLNDLNIIRAYINKLDAQVPLCDAAPIITGPYNFWTN